MVRAVIRVLTSGVWGGVDPAGWSPFRESVGVEGAGPAVAGEVVMVVGAEEGEVVEVGGSTVGPVDDVVALAVFRGLVAAREAAAAVAGVEGDGLAAAGEAASALQIEYNAVGVLGGVVDLGLVGGAADGVGAQQGSVGRGSVAGGVRDPLGAPWPVNRWGRWGRWR